MLADAVAKSVELPESQLRDRLHSHRLGIFLTLTILTTTDNKQKTRPLFKE